MRPPPADSDRWRVPPRNKRTLQLLIAIRSLVVLVLILVGLLTGVWRNAWTLLVWVLFTGWFAFLVVGLLREYRRRAADHHDEDGLIDG